MRPINIHSALSFYPRARDSFGCWRSCIRKAILVYGEQTSPYYWSFRIRFRSFLFDPKLLTRHISGSGWRSLALNDVKIHLRTLRSLVDIPSIQNNGHGRYICLTRPRFDQNHPKRPMNQLKLRLLNPFCYSLGVLPINFGSFSSSLTLVLCAMMFSIVVAERTQYFLTIPGFVSGSHKLFIRSLLSVGFSPSVFPPHAV